MCPYLEFTLGKQAHQAILPPEVSAKPEALRASIGRGYTEPTEVAMTKQGHGLNPNRPISAPVAATPDPVALDAVASPDLHGNELVIRIDTTIRTDGTSLWSPCGPTSVRITSLELFLYPHEPDYAELAVGFDGKSWDRTKDGLIYTDRGFEAGLGETLVAQGMPPEIARGARYSEQGMQGDCYVSFDVDRKFVKAFKALARTKAASQS